MHWERRSNSSRPSRPPVLQISARVELAALVVEAVRQLVADRAAGVAVVRRVVHPRVVERGLQHARRKIDRVHLRVEISVDGRRRHPPLGAIERLADLVELAPRLEAIAALDIARVIARPHFVRAVIAPPVG
jgi:hypothetical protein